MSETYLIGIGGPSCAGKTELAHYLSQLLPAPVLSLDYYYNDLGNIPLDQRGARNFDIPDALDHELFVRQLAEYAAGHPLAHPIYDFKTHSRTRETQVIAPGRFLIVEGLFALYWSDVRRLLGTKVFVDAPDNVCLERRVIRDVRERGRTPESVHEQFAQTVRPMAERYVRPTRDYADLRVSGELPLTETGAAVLEHARRQDAARMQPVRS